MLGSCWAHVGHSLSHIGSMFASPLQPEPRMGFGQFGAFVFQENSLEQDEHLWLVNQKGKNQLSSNRTIGCHISRALAIGKIKPDFWPGSASTNSCLHLQMNKRGFVFANLYASSQIYKGEPPAWKKHAALLLFSLLLHSLVGQLLLLSVGGHCYTPNRSTCEVGRSNW